MLPQSLYTKCKKSLGYIKNDQSDELNQCLENLPYKLRVELTLHIYEQRYKNITFFYGKTPSFISWMCTLLKPMSFDEHQKIYFEGEEVQDISFLIKG